MYTRPFVESVWCDDVVQKGFGYHLDLFVLSLLIVVCSVLGLPWFVAATVRSVTHVRSLIKYSDVSAPGERPEMLGVRYVRLANARRVRRVRGRADGVWEMRQVNGVKLTDIMFSLLCVCVSVRTQSHWFEWAE